MDNAALTELKEDWLTGNAVVALLGALLVGQSWTRILEGSESTIELFFLFTIPNYTAFILLVLIFGLFGLSLFLALASIVPSIRHSGLRMVRVASPMLALIILASFVLSWLSSSSELPSDQWWSLVLFLGGAGMFLFVGFRRAGTSMCRFLNGNIRRFIMSESKVANQADWTDDVEPDEVSERMRLGARLRGLPIRAQMVKSGGFWIVASVVVAAVGVLLTVLFWDWLRDGESGSTTVRNVGLMIGASIAFVLAIWRALVADRQANTAYEALLNERYQIGAEMLGNDVLSVSIGGIQSLRDLAKERPEQYHVRTMRLLCAFARNPAKSETEGELATNRVHSDIPFLMLRDDLQAVMDVIRGRSSADVNLEETQGFRLQLQFANLRGAILHLADLRRAMLWGADLCGSYLVATRLDCAALNDARLSDAQFSNEGDDPAKGLIQHQLDKALRDSEAAPKLTGVLDCKTGKPLIWHDNLIVDEACG